MVVEQDTEEVTKEFMEVVVWPFMEKDMNEVMDMVVEGMVMDVVMVMDEVMEMVVEHMDMIMFMEYVMEVVEDMVMKEFMEMQLGIILRQIFERRVKLLNL